MASTRSGGVSWGLLPGREGCGGSECRWDVVLVVSTSAWGFLQSGNGLPPMPGEHRGTSFPGGFHRGLPRGVSVFRVSRVLVLQACATARCAMGARDGVATGVGFTGEDFRLDHGVLLVLELHETNNTRRPERLTVERGFSSSHATRPLSRGTGHQEDWVAAVARRPPHARRRTCLLELEPEGCASGGPQQRARVVQYTGCIGPDGSAAKVAGARV